MIKYLILFILLIFLLLPVSAQNDYKPGYVLTNDGDTIKGFINLKLNYQNGKNCEFKENMQDVAKNYSPADIKAYRIENSKYYVAKDVSVDSIKNRVFLEYLVDGIVDLYFLNNGDVNLYFIEKDNRLVMLTNNELKVMAVRPKDKVFPIEVENRINSNRYKGVLKVLFQDSPETLKKIDNTSFDYKPLINIIKEYHNNVCNGAECIDYSKSTASKIYVDAGLGCYVSVMGFSLSPDKSISINPSFNFNIHSKVAKLSDKINVSAGICFTRINFSAVYFSTYDNVDEDYQIELKSMLVKVPFKLEYLIYTKKYQPYLTVFYDNIVYLNPEYSINKVNNYPRNLSSVFRKYHYGIGIGAGMRYLNPSGSFFYFDCSFEYQKPSINTNYFFDYMHNYCAMVSLGYAFLRK
jgi:hypothetical protein